MYILLGIGMCIVGAISIFAPKVGWYLDSGWKYKNTEPSDFYIIMSRFGGALTLIIGIGLMLCQISSGIEGIDQAKQISKKFEVDNMKEVTYMDEKHTSFDMEQVEEFGNIMASARVTKTKSQEWCGGHLEEIRIKFQDDQIGIIEYEGYDTFKFYILETERFGNNSYSRTYGKYYILHIPKLKQWLNKNFDKNQQQA